jgi:AcrR family transcriptional regulator
MASRPTRRLPPEQRREQLLDVLTKIVLDEGFGAVSIDRVARDADIARTVVYSQFGNLEGMLNALMDRASTRAVGQVSAVIPELPVSRDPDELLVDAIRSFTTLVRDHPRLWRLVLFPVEGAPPVVRERIAQGRAAVFALLEPLVEWGVQARGGPADMDTELLARGMLTMGEDAARIVVADPENFTPDRIADFTATLLRALARPERPDLHREEGQGA